MVKCSSTDKNIKSQQDDLNVIIESVEVSEWRHLNLGLNLNLGWYHTFDLLRSLIPATGGGSELRTSNMQEQFLNALIHKAVFAYQRFTANRNFSFLT